MKKIKTIKPFFHNLVAGKVNEITVDLDFSVEINERIGISDYAESEDSCVGFTSDFIIEKIIINENNKVLKLKKGSNNMKNIKKIFENERKENHNEIVENFLKKNKVENQDYKKFLKETNGCILKGFEIPYENHIFTLDSLFGFTESSKKINLVYNNENGSAGFVIGRVSKINIHNKLAPVGLLCFNPNNNSLSVIITLAKIKQKGYKMQDANLKLDRQFKKNKSFIDEFELVEPWSFMIIPLSENDYYMLICKQIPLNLTISELLEKIQK